jgi:hypothetical protein
MDTWLSEVQVFKLFRAKTTTGTVATPTIVIALDIIKHGCSHYFPAGKVLAVDTRVCHDELRRKKIKALIPPRSGARYWPADYADRNQAVANQRLTGDNTRWKNMTGYHRRSVAETAMYRVK